MLFFTLVVLLNRELATPTGFPTVPTRLKDDYRNVTPVWEPHDKGHYLEKSAKFEKVNKGTLVLSHSVVEKIERYTTARRFFESFL